MDEFLWQKAYCEETEKIEEVESQINTQGMLNNRARDIWINIKIDRVERELRKDKKWIFFETQKSLDFDGSEKNETLNINLQIQGEQYIVNW